MSDSTKKARKGIILAGGTGSRLHPVTIAISKQLLPVYNKPMIYYPLSVLMLSGIKEIAIITTPQDRSQFQKLMGDGSQWDIELTWITQPTPDGLAQAYILAEDFLDGAPSAMILGDNIFYGQGFSEMLQAANQKTSGGTVFGYHVSDPRRFGVLGFDADGVVTSIHEKPDNPLSNYAITGLYFLDETASERARHVTPSPRGELEIVSLLESYREEQDLNVQFLGRGFAWLDTGTFESLIEASDFVRIIEARQSLKVGCPDEIARSWKQS